MFTKASLYRYISPRMIQRGQLIQQHDQVGDLMVFDNDITGMTEIETWVESSSYKDEYEVRIVLGRSDNIITSTCTCPYYDENFTPCKHIAAVLLEYIEEEQLSILGSGYKREPISLKSNSKITRLIDSFSPTDNIDLLGQVCLLPSLSFGENHTLDVSFTLGLPNEHMYVIQSIDSFCSLIKNNEFKKYGKALEFTHSIDAFDDTSKPLISFLMSLYNKDDSYLESNEPNYYNYSYYGYSSPTMHRSLHLKGRYLDTFMTLLLEHNIPFEPIYWNITKGIPVIHTSLKKNDKGCNLQGDSYYYAKGNQYLYVSSSETRTIYQTESKKLEPLLTFLDEADGEPAFIAEEDLPKFSKYIYPILSTNTLVQNEGYDPYDYVIDKPNFEIYLDSPQKDIITCELKAVYQDAVYNILKSPKQGKRDIDEEKRFEQQIKPHFTSFDENSSLLNFVGSDEMLYNFITVTIPHLQSITTVYISDALKRMTIKPMSKVSVGVSVNHDLLQLDLVSNDLSLKEISDILSKYDRKKKFYRLKDGSFISTEDSNIEELLTLKDTLALKKKEIENGSIELPKFRAMYLESLQDNNAYNLEYDNSFRRMIQNMDAINQEEYDPPSDLNAKLRSYQLNGMQWLCALRDNGFGGLLADEMGLGKTLQVIAMLGNWKNRKRTLIVCPASLVYNWSKEIDKFLPSLPHRMIQGTPEERKNLIKTSAKNEVLITSYHILQRDVEYYEDMHFSCEVIDEAQYIKNANTLNSQAVKSIDAEFKVALTGTPIENRLSELWSIFDYLMPGFFYSYQTFKARFENPIVRDNDDLMERELNQMITPFVLRRLKKDVLKDLPDKLEEVYYAQLEGEQKQLYDAEVQKIKLMLTQQTDQEFKENKIAILAELTRLRQLCCYPGLLYENYKLNSSKTDMGIDLICNAIEGGHKILLFSQFTSMLEELEKRLKEKKIKYYLLEGKTPKKKRADMVDAFQQDDVPLFLISLKAGGTGLNLTAADIVIHYDPWWNTAVENQASDRAHRIGQTNVVTVYKLIMKDTIEERILELQAQKSDLANRILSGDGISSAQLTRDDLLALL